MTKPAEAGFFVSCYVCDYDNTCRTRRQVEDSTLVRRDAGNNVLRMLLRVALEIAEAEAN